MLSFKHKIQPKFSVPFLCCILPTVHFPSPNLLHFPTFFFFYLTASLSLAECQAGSAWQPSEQPTFLLPPCNNKCSAPHYTSFVFPSFCPHFSMISLIPLNVKNETIQLWMHPFMKMRMVWVEANSNFALDLAQWWASLFTIFNFRDNCSISSSHPLYRLSYTSSGRGS